jgi:hypothetical protein
MMLLIKIYAVTTSFQDAISKYRNYYQNVLDQFSNALDLITLDPDTLSDFINTLNNAQENLNTTVLSGSNISAQVRDLYNKMTNLTADKTSRSVLNQSFFNFSIFGQDYNNTLPRVEAQKNRKILQQLVNSNALINEYLNTAQTIYQTEEAIETQINILNSQYDFILNNNFFKDVDNINQVLFDETTIDSIVFLRDKTAQYLSQQITNAKRIETVYVNNVSLIELCISLYGDTQLYNTLAELNKFANQATISGEIKVLSQ